MNLVELRPLFASAIKGFKIDTGKATSDAYINMAYIELFESHRWEFRKKTGSIVVPPYYTTGTCSVVKYDGTNGTNARKVTFSGATISDKVGWYFQAEDSSNWHKIVYVSGSTAYLDSEVTDIDSGSGLTFKLWKRFCYVKSDVDVVYDIGKWGDDVISYTQEALDRSQSYNTPDSYRPFGVDSYDDVEYSVGTVSGSSESNVLTFSGGTDLIAGGFNTGDIIIVGQKTFYIKRVETETRAVLFNYLSEAIESQSFAIKKISQIGFEFNNQSEEYKVLPYTYLSRAYPLIHESKDVIQLTRRFIPAIISRAIYFAMRDNQDDRMTAQLAIYVAEAEGLREKVRVLEPRYTVFGSNIPNFMPGRG